MEKQDLRNFAQYLMLAEEWEITFDGKGNATTWMKGTTESAQEGLRKAEDEDAIEDIIVQVENRIYSKSVKNQILDILQGAK